MIKQEIEKLINSWKKEVIKVEIKWNEYLQEEERKFKVYRNTVNILNEKIDELERLIPVIDKMLNEEK